MKFDPTSIAGFIAALLVASGLLFAIAACALWLRRKLERASLGGGPHADGRIDEMRPGRQFVVLQDFTDDRGARFAQGQVLTFVDAQGCFDATTMLRFNERTMRLHAVRQADIVLHIRAYLAPAARRRPR